MRVLFVSLQADSAENITNALAIYYAYGWRVISHSEDENGYSFVLEQSKGGDPQ